MKSRAKSDNFDRHFLAKILVILDDVTRIIESEVHHRRFVGVHLQDKAVWLLDSLRRFVLVTALSFVVCPDCFLFTCASDEGATKSSAAIAAAAPAIFLRFVMEFLPIW